MKNILKYTLIVIFLFTGIIVKAQSEMLNRQLSAVWNKYLSSYDRSPDHDLTYGALYEGGYKIYTLTLKEYWTYKITTVCDGDCGDIDLYLYDYNDNLIDSDNGTDDYPIVGVTPKWTGTFQIKIKMAGCSRGPCSFGLAVFRK